MSYFSGFRRLFAPASRLTAAALIAGTGFLVLGSAESAQAVPSSKFGIGSGIFAPVADGRGSKFSRQGIEKIKWEKPTGKDRGRPGFTGKPDGRPGFDKKFKPGDFTKKKKAFGSILAKIKKDHPPHDKGRYKGSPSQVPLPAAAWLLIGGIGALGAASRKRKAAPKA